MAVLRVPVSRNRGAREVLEAAMKLEPTEREQLAHELLESIGESSDVALSPKWEAEIQRRLRKIERERPPS